MQIASNKIQDVIRFFKQELDGLYEPSEIDVFISRCFEHFLAIKRIDLLHNAHKTMSESDLLKFNFAIKDLKKCKPLQQILGYADFYGLAFFVNESVLIPRPETEELVDLIIKDNESDTPEILDIGTGSGCISICLKKNIVKAKVSAVDVSTDALLVAKKNAELIKIDVNFLELDILNNDSWKLFDGKKFDIIVSNPPYICIDEKNTMQKNVLGYEPHLALFVNDSNPLLFYDVIANFALKYLKPNGKLYFEINEKLGAESKQLLENKGFKNVVLFKDLSKKNRILRSNIFC
ncbi:MAG: peptide chain release factor N(5)-glutamine methyltransferase [Bacteroidia bacterium]|nr:peptide chain release factor N(5)-glutamine methyltransferase [Bacteroidia bacterium]